MSSLFGTSESSVNFPNTLNHETDKKLLEYSKKINQCAFVAFAIVIIINFIFFIIYCIVGRVFVFPISEWLYFDVKNDLFSSILYTINWILLCSVIYSQLLLQEMNINFKSIMKTVAMFFLLNLFGTVNSIFIMYPIVSVLNYTFFYRFKSKITFFVNATANDILTTPNNIKNDKYLRLIAINHFLSKLCYRLSAYSLHKKSEKINNETVYKKLENNLDKKLCDIMQSKEEKNVAAAEQIYKECVEFELDSQRIYHRLTFRLYAIAINVSMIRCLFWSGLDLFNKHQWVYYAYFCKLSLELIGCVFILIWCYFDKKLLQIKQNELKTRFYYIVLQRPDMKRAKEIVFDGLLKESEKFYVAWKYALDGPFTRHVLNGIVGKDLSGTICTFVFETVKIGKVEINEVFWKEITDALDADPQ